jgi:hypothetical protein
MKAHISKCFRRSWFLDQEELIYRERHYSGHSERTRIPSTRLNHEKKGGTSCAGRRRADAATPALSLRSIDRILHNYDIALLRPRVKNNRPSPSQRMPRSPKSHHSSFLIAAS